MTAMLNNASKILLQLLSIALGNSKTCSLPDEINWQEVMTLAERQGVLGVAFDAMDILPSVKRPDMDTLMDWLGQVSYMESVYEEYISAIRSFGDFCELQEVPVLLMKGYGCSLNYPNPNHRPCGDIDVYLGKYKPFIEQLLADMGTQIEYDNEHHSVFTYQGFTVENHETIMDANSHKSNGYINQLLEQLAIGLHQEWQRGVRCGNTIC